MKEERGERKRKREGAGERGGKKRVRGKRVRGKGEEEAAHG